MCYKYRFLQRRPQAAGRRPQGNQNYLPREAKKKVKSFCLCLQLNLKHEKPIFSSGSAKKTPEYSGVFSGIFVTNIGFSNI